MFLSEQPRDGNKTERYVLYYIMLDVTYTVIFHTQHYLKASWIENMCNLVIFYIIFFRNKQTMD